MSAGFRSVGTPATGTTSVSLTAPGGVQVVGDVMFAFIVDHATSGTSAAPTGWTNQVSVSDANGRFQCFSAVAGANGLTGSVWSFTGLTTTAIGCIITVLNADPVAPLDVSSARNNASGTTGTTSITPTKGKDSFLIAGFCSYANGATWTTEAVATNPGALTEKVDSANGTACSLALAVGSQSGALAATGASSVTMSANAANGAILIAVPSIVDFTYGAQPTTLTPSVADHNLNYGAQPTALTPLLSYNFVNNAPVWGGWTMDDGEVGIAYREQWYLEGCGTPVTFSIFSGSLPPGLSLSSIVPALGQVAGTPTTVGTYSFALKAANSYGSAIQGFSITITASPSGGSYTFQS